MRKETIGVMGTSQINHIIPLISTQYNVINLQEVWDKEENKIKRFFSFIRQLMKCNILYNVYSSHYFWKKGRLAKFLGKKVITHWIGSDVRFAIEGKTNVKKLKFVNQHLACFEPLQKQLHSLGIETKYLPIIPYNLCFDVCKMPKEHAVLIYMPKGYEEYYGFNEISKVFPRFPEVKFFIVANDDKEKFVSFNNVETLGYLTLEQMELLYNKISIVVRIHTNDGLSMSVLEGMAKGKKIIWNCEFPHCFPGATTEDICSSLYRIIKLTPTPSIDIDSHNYIISNFSKDKFMDMFNDIVHNLL